MQNLQLINPFTLSKSITPSFFFLHILSTVGLMIYHFRNIPPVTNFCLFITLIQWKLKPGWTLLSLFSAPIPEYLSVSGEICITEYINVTTNIFNTNLKWFSICILIIWTCSCSWMLLSIIKHAQVSPTLKDKVTVSLENTFLSFQLSHSHLCYSLLLCGVQLSQLCFILQ